MFVSVSHSVNQAVFPPVFLFLLKFKFCGYKLTAPSSSYGLELWVIILLNDLLIKAKYVACLQ